MSVPNLSDGTPLTYEWLNQLADTVNVLYAKEEAEPDILFVGDVTGKEIQVVTGSVKINAAGKNISGSKISSNNIKFKKAFADKKTIVIAMVTSTAAKQNNAPIPAGVAVGEITETGFDAIIQLFNEEKTLGKVSFELKYVAIGKRVSTS